jgi:starch-binding outer membrane protein, SusD/RagB family
MKSIKLFFIFLILGSFIWSCNFLDYTESDQYDKKDIFFEYARVKTILTNVYSFLPTDFNSVDGAVRSSASDDAEHVWDVSNIQKFNDGSWNSLVILDDQWANMYSGIRSANVFLKESEGQTFPELQYNLDYKQTMEQFALYPYEARFLRAFFYFELIKRYRNVPLITSVLTQEEANKVSPSPFEDIVKFIVSECDAAAAKLPTTFAGFSSTSETGRATKGAALALKARTLLYAASPLHNTANDLTKWMNAANASKAIIDQLASTYTPLPAYTAIVNSLTSKELIFERREGTANAFEAANTAIGFTGGNTGTCPTQNLVDAYEMKANGLGINETGSGYVSATPYTGRDPRLAFTILFNGSIWKTPLVVETWYGGLNAPPKANATKTGYYLKKYLVESISLNPVNPTLGQHYWVIFRYAEVLLNYAEAMNEAYGPDVAGPAPLTLTAREAVNIVRARTGVAMPNFPVGMTQSAFRVKLRNERRVELAFEDHRFWDIRRWKIGNTTKDIYGVEITKDPAGVLNYTKKLVESRAWDDKMYLYPIPQAERFINDKLGQNPGW